MENKGILKDPFLQSKPKAFSNTNELRPQWSWPNGILEKFRNLVDFQKIKPCFIWSDHLPSYTLAIPWTKKSVGPLLYENYFDQISLKYLIKIPSKSAPKFFFFRFIFFKNLNREKLTQFTRQFYKRAELQRGMWLSTGKKQLILRPGKCSEFRLMVFFSLFLKSDMYDIKLYLEML